MLEFSEVRFSYGSAPVLDGVSLQALPGQLTAVIGPNGSGKSTLLRLGAGLIAPVAGDVLFDGIPLRHKSRRSIAQTIALLPQDSNVPEDMIGSEAVLMGRSPHVSWLSNESAADRRIAYESLVLLESEHLADRRFGEMSGGERRRVLLARALAQEAQVLLMDEPAAHLDPSHQLGLLQTIRELMARTNLAVLAVFHEVNLAIEYCDQIVAIEKGKVAAIGTPESVISAEFLERLYGVEFSVVMHPQSGKPAVLYPSATTGKESSRCRE